MKVGFVSLGCSKNLVDTEMMIGLFQKRKYEIVNQPQEAEVIVINTCGFIASAKEEAIQTILEMAEYKKTKKGNCKILIVTGCLVERYYKELENALPEVDIFLKYSDYAQNTGRSNEIFNQVFSKIEKRNVQDAQKLEFQDRVITTGKQYAYIRIAEGCDNHCTYCAIPSIRGKFVSRTMEDIVEEAKKVAKSGISEIILIAQDTSKYGIDLYGKYMLSELLQSLSTIDEIQWIRFLYTYPESITDELIEVVKNNEKICHYFDIPIQHISNSVLKRMGRKTTKEQIQLTVKKLRKEIPDVIIRTTVMVGFPGESKHDFEELYQFLQEEKFDKLGAFMYSKEDGTPAAKLKDQIHPMTKKARWNKIMKLQQEILLEARKQYLGKKIKVAVDGRTTDNQYWVGRSYMDVPEIDGLVYITGKEVAQPYQWCKITKVTPYDMYGDFIENE